MGGVYAILRFSLQGVYYYSFLNIIDIFFTVNRESVKSREEIFLIGPTIA